MDIKQSRLSQKPFGLLPNGQKVTLYTLTNQTGACVDIIDLGATIVSLNMPDRDGQLSDIALGFDNPNQYFNGSNYLGAIVGRYANRIRDGKFNINEKEYSLPRNDASNSLHGGTIGFDKNIWDVKTFEEANQSGLVLSMVSEDGDQGYPGTLNVSVKYCFDDNNNLSVNYHATTDKTTVVNLSQHTYFNLNGHASGSVLEQELSLNACHYTPVDKSLIPTGEITSVQNSPMDFRTSKPIGRDINTENEQLSYGNGYDHNWVLDRDKDAPSLAATVYAPKTGRVMEVFTNKPGIQFYSGNFLDSAILGKNGTTYNKHSGFCLETQNFPDSPNHSNFPSTILQPNDTYQSTTIFKFQIRK